MFLQKYVHHCKCTGKGQSGRKGWDLVEHRRANRTDPFNRLPRVSFMVPTPCTCATTVAYLDICFNPLSDNVPQAGQHHLLHLLEPLFHHALCAKTDRRRWWQSIKAQEGCVMNPALSLGRAAGRPKAGYLFKPEVCLLNYLLYIYWQCSRKYMPP